MPKQCAFGCEQRNEPMHRFPNPKKYPERYAIWYRYLRTCLKELHKDNHANWSVCDLHFELQYKNRNNRLNALAVPTLHLRSPLPNTPPHNDHPYSKETGKVPVELPRPETVIALNAKDEPSIDLPPRSRKLRPQINIPLDMPLFDRAKFSPSNINDAGDEFNGYTDTPSPGPEENHENVKSELPEEKIPEPIFSWEKDIDLVPTDEREEVAGPTIASNVELAHSPVDITTYWDDDRKTDPVETVKHTEYKCNGCHKPIVGFRYTCVQCADWDLCAACEARAAHAAHYVLRVPGARPYNEIQAVLTAVRQQLLSENLFLNDGILTSIKVEPKDESDSENVRPAAAPPDPLEEWISGAEQELSETSAANGTGSSPLRKRRRNTSETKPQPLIPLRKANMSRGKGGGNPRTERSIQSTIQSTGFRATPNILQRNKEKQITTPFGPGNLLRRVRSIPFKDSENRTKSEKCSQTEGWPIKESIAISPYILHMVQKPRLKTINNLSRLDDQRTQPNTAVKTMPCGELYEQTDSPEDQAQVEPGLFYYEPKICPSAYQLTGNLQVLDDKSHPKGMRNKVGRPRKVTALKKAAESNLKGKASGQTVLLKIPPGTSALDLSKALQYQAFVRIERLKEDTLKSCIKKIKNK